MLRAGGCRSKQQAAAPPGAKPFTATPTLSPVIGRLSLALHRPRHAAGTALYPLHSLHSSRAGRHVAPSPRPTVCFGRSVTVGESFALLICLVFLAGSPPRGPDQRPTYQTSNPPPAWPTPHARHAVISSHDDPTEIEAFFSSSPPA
ncbi:hypothetical protein COCC4DRAFT_66309 [Bipolaris maydis ATCC 48331]|uniref:Uncharacterized protein n=2 Tax=Cochliobolus heterostrophus TaxID=5016 RepID=M2SK42_COCH5|nr:uncharacterized protein COCC4DRAFT_66309 [Bipolaris maydis ATCC 48331]EMD85710.1 hypothetical protein COCHEDRAFT_1118062 [Bipolaris maydis C5]ENH99580.1 hypothetical protein COCC4DRAFT_66309 [Bipolaris maydis ATCC 48331]